MLMMSMSSRSPPDWGRPNLNDRGPCVKEAAGPLSAADFIPIKAIFNAARSASSAAPHVAEISAEMEVLDPSGRIVGSAVSTRKSDKTLEQGERVTWKDMQSIAAVWAKSLRQHLDYQRGYAAK